MKQIKNIIFDLGGVFLNIDLKLTEKAFRDLGLTDFAAIYSLSFSIQLFENLETGAISPSEFYDGIRDFSGLPLSDQQIQNAWNALLLDFPEERLIWLNSIRGKYNIYLFSNTNKIHYDHFMNTYQLQTGGKNFNDFFLKAWYSHEVALRKPSPQSFLNLMQQENLSATETLFIDDTFVNIEGASRAGLHTRHLVAPKTVIDLEL